MRILVLEDNITLATAIREKLISSNYAVDVFDDGYDGKCALESGHYDLLILDLGLPSVDGIDILKNLRKNQNKLPVLIVSARDKLNQKILGLQSGADDYLTKPFALDEVIARVNALLRRTLRDGQELVKLNDLVYDCSNRTLLKDNQIIELSQRETSVLEYMISNKNRIISKEKILDHISSYDDEINTTAIETYISRLRKKIGKYVEFKTIRGLGYMIRVKN